MQLYDRIAAGDRIRQRRLLLGMTQEELAEKIGRAYKYCQDIERGSCGMSIETLILLSSPRGIKKGNLLPGD
jgi:transcriptional regulator with XRE-family HTH domain